jgi:hypothetical protein
MDVQLHTLVNEHAESETYKKELDNSVKVGVGREYSHTRVYFQHLIHKTTLNIFLTWLNFLPPPTRHVLLLCVISRRLSVGAVWRTHAIVLTFDDAGQIKNLIMTGWGLLGTQF